MGNHVTATSSEIIILQYSNGIRTMLTIKQYDGSYVINTILKYLHGCEKDICEDIKIYQNDIDDSRVCGYVWHIDNILNYEYDSCQYLLTPDDRIARSKTILMPYCYDLGENESEEDIKKYYPNYKFPYKK